jgi:hypothetical protein
MWLPKNDPRRRRGDLFNGKDELEGPPPKRSSIEIDILLKDWKKLPSAGKDNKEAKARREEEQG